MVAARSPTPSPLVGVHAVRSSRAPSILGGPRRSGFPAPLPASSSSASPDVRVKVESSPGASLPGRAGAPPPVPSSQSDGLSQGLAAPDNMRFSTRPKRIMRPAVGPSGLESVAVGPRASVGGKRPLPAAAPVSSLDLPVGDPRFQLLAANFVRSRKGKRLTEAQKAEQRTHDEVQGYRKEQAADWLVSVVPPDLRDWMLGGDLAVAQNPDPAERAKALRAQFLHKAGSDGSALGKARRFLEAVCEMAPSAAMPAGRLLVHRTIERGKIDALTAATGSQGGATVGASLRSGAKTAQDIGFPVDADNVLVDSAAPPQKKRRREKRSGSAPISWYCHVEEKCKTLPPGPQRLWCRQQTICNFHARLRNVDVLRASVRHGGYTASGGLIIVVFTSFSKDGAPIDVYINAEGFTGAFDWAEEHLRDVAQFDGYCLPAFTAPKGRAGHVGDATALLSRTTSKAHAITSLQDLTSMAPLCATPEEWARLGITPHFGHGSMSDMAAVIGPHAPPDVAMTDADERELGHWRRLATASPDGEMVIDDLVKDSMEHQRAADAAARAQKALPAAAPPAMRAEDASMRVRYTSGTNREGRKRAQLRVHLRLVTAVRRALAKFGDWRDLPKDRTEYDILEDIPEALEA